MASRQSQRGTLPSQQQTKLNRQLQVPKDENLEEAILGAILLEKNVFQDISNILEPKSFYKDAHQRIYRACQDLAANRKPIDLLTVGEQLRLNGDFEEVGGNVVLAQLARTVSSGVNAEFHARIVAQKYIARQLIEFGDKLVSNAYDESKDIDDVMHDAESQIFELGLKSAKKGVRDVSAVLIDAMRRLRDASKRGDELSGVSTGFSSLDKMTAGWQQSNLIIVAARPSMGKSALALNMAYRMAVQIRIPVAVFSLEMSDIELTNRLMSIASGIDGKKIRSGALSNVEWDTLFKRCKPLTQAPISMDDTSGLSIFELETKARQLVRDKQVQAIFIDYLQLMNAQGAKFYSREQEVSIISRRLKQLAKELNIPIIALSQLNRSVESRGEGKRPQLSDLRESGAIEQDADIVCFLHRPDYYYPTGIDANGIDVRGRADVIFAKNRSGDVGDVQLRFNKSTTTFLDSNDIDLDLSSNSPNAKHTPF